MLNPRDIDDLLDKLSKRSTFAKPELIVLGDIVRETFSEDSEIWKAYKELYEQFQKDLSNDGQRRSPKAHTREFKEIVDAAKTLASRREIPPPTKDQREYQEKQVECIIDRKLTQSKWFDVTKWVLGLGLLLVIGGSASFGFVSINLSERIKQVTDYVDQTEKKLQQKLEGETAEFIKNKKAEFEKNLETTIVGLAAEGKAKLDGIISAKEKELGDIASAKEKELGDIASAKEKELGGIVSAKEIELGGTIKAATDRTQTLEIAYAKQVKQRQDNLDKIIGPEQLKLDQLVSSVSGQEKKLNDLASRLDGLQSISRPALDIANTLSSGTATNNLQLVGKVLELSTCFLIGLTILAFASFAVSGFALFYSRKKAGA